MLYEWILIIVGGLSILLDLWIAFLLGSEDYSLAIPLVIVSVVITSFCQWLWIRVLKKINGRHRSR
jgi:hypothetical protein